MRGIKCCMMHNPLIMLPLKNSTIYAIDQEIIESESNQNELTIEIESVEWSTNF